jgi:hypothetical protein
MAGFIQIENDREWTSANWVYYSVLDGVLEYVTCVGNKDLQNDVEQSKWMQTFDLTDVLVDHWRLLLIESLKHVCDSVDSGILLAKNDGKTLDAPSQLEFKNEVRKLAYALRGLPRENIG